MPLAYSTLLGGLMTLIGTPPNLLISESLSLNGYDPFELFDFTPIGGGVMAIGVIFVALFGRFMLPKKAAEHGKHVSQRSLRARYKLHEHTYMIRVPTDSILVGKTLAESRIGASTGLIILSMVRDGRSETLPGRQTVIRGGDGLLVQGRVDQFRELRRWSDLVIEREAPVLKSMVAAKVAYAEVCSGQDVLQGPGTVLDHGYLLIDESLPEDRASVMMPYEYRPLPVEGDVVTALDRAGHKLGDAKVIAVRQTKKMDQTATVTIEVPRDWSMRARAIRLKR